MTDSFKESALKYHTHPLPGKLEIRPTKPLANKRDLSLAYSPGVAHACELIVENPTAVASVTARGNLVAVITNGTPHVHGMFYTTALVLPWHYLSACVYSFLS